MNNKIILAKIGGSILNNKVYLTHTLEQFIELLKLGDITNLILIMGGGDYANRIRKAENTLDLDDSLSHWLAILAMDLNAYEVKTYCHNLYPSRCCFLNDIKSVEKQCNEKEGIIIFFGPFRYLYKEDFLPHSWDVTSDSIAYYLAAKLNLTECYLIKDVDGILRKEKDQLIKDISANQIKHLKNEDKLIKFTSESKIKQSSQPLDSHILELVNRFKLPCVLLNGTGTKRRIFEYFNPNHSEKIYTIIKSD